jgi:hypothetical protein
VKKKVGCFARCVILNCSGREMKVSHALVHTFEDVSIIDGVFVKLVVKVVAGCGRWEQDEKSLESEAIDIR